MLRRNTLNNLIMSNQRKSALYQTIITDLAITGEIDRDDAEMLLGYEIPNYLHTPDGQNINSDIPMPEPLKTDTEKPVTKTAAKETEPAKLAK